MKFNTENIKISPIKMFLVENDISYPENLSFGIMHKHDDLQFVVVKHGTIRIQSLGHSYIIHENEGVFINTNVLHEIQRNKNSSYLSFLFPSYILKMYIGSIAEQIGNQILNDTSIDIVCLKEKTWEIEVINSLKEIYKSSDNSEMNQWKCELFLNQCWYLLCSNVERKQHSRNIAHQRIAIFLEYIQKNYMNDMTLKDISNSAGVSETECLRCFQTILHVTPIAYLNAYRLQESTVLLVETNLSISEVSERCGFHQQAYFGKVFKEKLGMTPFQYRKNTKSNVQLEIRK